MASVYNFKLVFILLYFFFFKLRHYSISYSLRKHCFVKVNNSKFGTLNEVNKVICFCFQQKPFYFRLMKNLESKRSCLLTAARCNSLLKMEREAKAKLKPCSEFLALSSSQSFRLLTYFSRSQWVETIQYKLPKNATIAHLSPSMHLSGIKLITGMHLTMTLYENFGQSNASNSKVHSLI